MWDGKFILCGNGSKINASTLCPIVFAGHFIFHAASVLTAVRIFSWPSKPNT